MTTAPTERQVEAQVRDLFLRAGWYADLKTDAALVVRGGRRRGTIQTGFPDRVMLLGLGGGLCLAALIELKTDTGRLSTEQVEMHAHLRDAYRIHPHTIRSPQEAVGIIRAGLALKAALKDVV
jgi:hypothetical protein